MELIRYAAEQIDEEKLWNRWVVAAQHISFTEFKNSLRPPKFKNDDDLMDDVKSIIDGGSHGNF